MKNRGLLVALFIFLILLAVSIPYLIKLLNFSGFATSGEVTTRPLFSIRMLDFESPVRLGSFLKFSYLVRDISNTDDTAKLNFWLEKDGEIVSLGLDTIYLGNLEEKTRTGAIFLPSNLKAGVYNFRIKLDYGGYSAESYRTIEIGVVNGLAIINQGATNSNIYIYLSLILLVLLNIIVLYFIRKNRGKKIFSKIKDLFRKHKKQKPIERIK